jgi:hypothetical protein
MRPAISSLRFKRAGAAQRKRGVLGWLSFVMTGVLIDSVSLRRSLKAELVFSRPTKTNGHGGRRHVLRPVDDKARQAIKDELLSHLASLLDREGRETPKVDGYLGAMARDQRAQSEVVERISRHLENALAAPARVERHQLHGRRDEPQENPR